jgi:hypothetical protein
MIRRFNLATPGREPAEGDSEDEAATVRSP